MGQLRDRMVEDLDLRSYSEGTKETYLGCVRFYAAHYMRPPEELGRDDVRRFLLHMRMVRKVAPTTLRTYVAALKFLYAHTLERPEVVAGIPWPRVKKTLPVVLSPDEVQEVLAAIEPLRFRVLFITAYATGLRISEACSLKIEDIDSRRGVIRIRDGKRGRDRYVMLGDQLLVLLRAYFAKERPRGPWLFPYHDAGTHIPTYQSRRILKRSLAKIDSAAKALNDSRSGLMTRATLEYIASHQKPAPSLLPTSGRAKPNRGVSQKSPTRAKRKAAAPQQLRK